MNKLFNILEGALNIRSSYHRIIAGNIANADTPHYKEKDIDFQSELNKRVNSLTPAKELIDIKEKSYSEDISSNNGNTVIVESQMVKMTENDIMYKTLVSIVSKKIAMMKYMISEGKR